MNLFKPKRTFESVVRELVAGLDEGTIVLNKEADAPKPKQQAIEAALSAGAVGIKVMATPSAEGKVRRFGLSKECVLEPIGERKSLLIDTGPFRAVRTTRKSS